MVTCVKNKIINAEKKHSHAAWVKSTATCFSTYIVCIYRVLPTSYFDVPYFISIFPRHHHGTILVQHQNFFLEAPMKQCKRQFVDVDTLINYWLITRTLNSWFYFEPLPTDFDNPN